MEKISRENVAHTKKYGDGIAKRNGEQIVAYAGLDKIDGIHLKQILTNEQNRDGLGDYETGTDEEHELTSQDNFSVAENTESEAKLLYHNVEVFARAVESANEKSENECLSNSEREKKFANLYGDGNTISWIGDNTQPFECEVCRRRFCTWFGLNKHAIITHDNKKHKGRRIHCSFHKKLLNTTPQYQTKTICSSFDMDPSPYHVAPQNQTGKQFLYQSRQNDENNIEAIKHEQLLKPKEAINHNEPFFQCDLCNRKFRHNSEFKLHMLGHLKPHFSMKKSSEDMNCSKKSQNRYIQPRSNYVKCEKCSKIFNGVKGFRKHLKMFADSTPYYEPYGGQVSRNFELLQTEKIIPGSNFANGWPKNVFSDRILVPTNAQWIRSKQCGHFVRPTSENVHQHVLQSTPNLAKCTHCGKAHARNCTQNQLCTLHKNPRTCYKCGKSHTRLSGIRQRQRLMPNRMKYLTSDDLYQQSASTENYQLIVRQETPNFFKNEQFREPISVRCNQYHPSGNVYSCMGRHRIEH